MPVVIRWNPAHNFFILDDPLDHLLDQASEVLHRKKTATSGSAWVPAADVYETDTTVIIQVELAGIEKKSLEITFEKGHLELRGTRPLSLEMQSAKIHRIERMYGTFQRSFWIPHTVDMKHLSASYTHGILRIVLPKVLDPSPENVTIPVTVTS